MQHPTERLDGGYPFGCARSGRVAEVLLDGLGTAEIGHVFITNRPGSSRPGTLGQVVPGFEVRVCDEDGKPLADGEPGYLWVRGKSRAIGYVQEHDKVTWPAQYRAAKPAAKSMAET